MSIEGRRTRVPKGEDFKVKFLPHTRPDEQGIGGRQVKLILPYRLSKDELFNFSCKIGRLI